jgi:hypothetical protein
MLQSRIGNHEVLLAITDPAIVLPPRHFVGVGIKVRAGDVVVHADLSAAHPREEAFGLIGTGFAVRIGNRVVDALCQISRVQHIPARSFVGIDHTASGDLLLNCRNRQFLRAAHVGKRSAVALAHDDDATPLARLIDPQPAIAAVLAMIAHPTKLGLSYIKQIASAHRLALIRAVTAAKGALSTSSKTKTELARSTVKLPVFGHSANLSSEKKLYSWVNAIDVMASITVK